MVEGAIVAQHQAHLVQFDCGSWLSRRRGSFGNKGFGTHDHRLIRRKWAGTWFRGVTGRGSRNRRRAGCPAQDRIVPGGWCIIPRDGITRDLWRQNFLRDISSSSQEHQSRKHHHRGQNNQRGPFHNDDDNPNRDKSLNSSLFIGNADLTGPLTRKAVLR